MDKIKLIKRVDDKDVSNLKVHHKFILLEGFHNYEGEALRSITFKPDFMFSKAGQTWIWDCKPLNKKLIDADFRIRWKLFQWMYREQDIKFRLVAWDKKSEGVCGDIKKYGIKRENTFSV